MVRGHLKYLRFGLSRNMLGPDIEIWRGVVRERLRSVVKASLWLVALSKDCGMSSVWKGELMMMGVGGWRRAIAGWDSKEGRGNNKKFTFGYVKTFLIFDLFKIVSTQVGSAFSYKPRQQGLIYLASSRHSSASLVRASLYESCTTCTSKMTSSKQCHFGVLIIYIFLLSSQLESPIPPTLSSPN